MRHKKIKTIKIWVKLTWPEIFAILALVSILGAFSSDSLLGVLAMDVLLFLGLSILAILAKIVSKYSRYYGKQ
ncbi:MAG: hypothetical protein PHT88_02460 [Candidatus Moranbacteria bacterium]|nr:hypothetical protein [Candidatus Moranbacteria bacterium]